MGLSLTETQVVSELSSLLYSFLPGKPHPYADRALSFEGIAQELGLRHYWPGGSKQPAITAFLTAVLERERTSFCKLVVEIVRRGMQYRASKGDPITKEVVTSLNQLLARLQWKIPELHDPSFLNGLPSAGPEESQATSCSPGPVALHQLHSRLLDLANLDPQKRGYAFERLLNDIFAAFGLAPRAPFRLTGEQIDGSLELDGDTYLVEARSGNAQADASDLYVLHGKVEGKAKWSRGLFISLSGFSPGGVKAYGGRRPTSLIGMSGEDLHYILIGKMSLPDALRKKARAAAETGRFYVSVHELAP